MYQSICRYSLLLLTLCFSSLSLASLVNHSFYSPNGPFQQTNGTLENLEPFTQLKVQGNVDVILRSAAWPSMRVENAQILTTPKPDNKQKKVLTVSYENNTLVIHGLSPLRSVIQLNVSQLNTLSTSGSAQISGRINSKAPLNIQTEDSSQVYLTGMMNLQQIQSSDNSQVKLYWVNSPALNLIASDNSSIKLAGATGIMHASLTDQAQLNGQYLRAQQAFVQTDNQAYAGVLAIQALRAFASDDSNIFYYKYPHRYNDFSVESGNILQVDWRP